MRTPLRFALATAAGLAVIALGGAWQAYARHHHAPSATHHAAPGHETPPPSTPQPRGTAHTR